MYIPPVNRYDDEAVLRDFVAQARAGWLVTSNEGAVPSATYLPVVWREDKVVAHLAKANEHWREIEDGSPALVIVTGPDAYVTPAWYTGKAEHGKVVPTWNYSAVHLHAVVSVKHDPEWLRMAVESLTEVHEQSRQEPWHVRDAPAAFVDAQLRGIVGVELTVTKVLGKAKLSQNRSEADRRAVAEGLGHSDRPVEQAVGAAMAKALSAEA